MRFSSVAANGRDLRNSAAHYNFITDDIRVEMDPTCNSPDGNLKVSLSVLALLWTNKFYVIEECSGTGIKRWLFRDPINQKPSNTQ